MSIYDKEVLNYSKKIISKNRDKIAHIFDNEDLLKAYYPHISLTPYVLEKNTYDNIARACDGIAELLEKTIYLYFNNKSVEKLINIEKFNKDFIQNFDVYRGKKQLYIGRFDGFVDDHGKFKFLELNIDYPGGFNRLDLINEKIKNIGYEKYSDDLSLYKDVFDMCAGLYKQYKKEKNDVFLIVYGDNDRERKIKGLEKFARDLTSNGAKTYACHIDKLEEKDGNLLYKNNSVCLVFHAPFLYELWEINPKGSKKIVKALDTGNLFMFNGPGTIIGAEKSLFALWHNQEFQKYLNSEEIENIRKYVPKTYYLNKINIDFKNKDKWVLKPVVGYGGGGVMIGKNCSHEDWILNVDKILKQKDNKYIIQEYITPTRYKMLELNLKTRDIQQKNTYLNISPWYIDGKFRGISGRYSESDIVNVTIGGGIISVFRK